ncbi:MAG: hypothetical protein JWO52_4078 [Gammaproteobacteria bacterium]|nr:hypothetical protein [Gammaproteobacteria bacterium]
MNLGGMHLAAWRLTAAHATPASVATIAGHSCQSAQLLFVRGGRHWTRVLSVFSVRHRTHGAAPLRFPRDRPPTAALPERSMPGWAWRFAYRRATSPVARLFPGVVMTPVPVVFCPLCAGTRRWYPPLESVAAVSFVQAVVEGAGVSTLIIVVFGIQAIGWLIACVRLWSWGRGS